MLIFDVFSDCAVTMRPYQHIPESEKTNKWYMDNCKFIYTQHFNSWLYEKQAKFSELRNYGLGCQNIDKYRDFYKNLPGADVSRMIHADNSDEKDNMGWRRINFESLLSPMPKTIDKIIGMLGSIKHEIEVSAIDQNSISQKKKKKSELKSKMINAGFYKKINELAGGEMIHMPQQLPENDEELDMYDRLGGNELDYEKALKKIIDWVLSYCDDTEIFYEVLFDLLTINCSLIVDYIDNTKQTTLVKHIDMENAILEYAPGENKYNSSYGGYVETYSIADLRQLCPDITEKELYDVACMYCTQIFFNNNTAKANLDLPDTTSVGTSPNYNDIRIPVGYFEWKGEQISSPTTYYKEKSFDGSDKKEKIYIKEHLVKKNELRSGKIKSEGGDSFKQNYICQWVLGTNHIFNYGKKYANTFDLTSKDTTLSMHFYFLKGKSITERAIPILDTNFAYAFYNLQNNIATASPTNSFLIQVEALENVGEKFFKNKNIKPIHLLSIGDQTGKYFYSAEMPGIPGGDAPKMRVYEPIKPIEGGIKRALEEFEMAIESGYNHLGNIIGIDRTSSVSSPDPKTPVKTNESLQASTQDTLKPIQTGLLSMKDNLCNNIAIRSQLIIAATPESNYDKDICGFKNILTKKEYLSVKEAGQDFPAQYNVKIKSTLADAVKSEILDTCKRMTAAGRNGKPALSSPEYLFIVDRLQHGGQIKEIIAYLAYKENKQKKEEQEVAENAQKNNQQGTQMLQAQKDKSEQDKIKLEKLLEKDNIVTKYRMETMSKIAIAKNETDNEIMKSMVLDPDSMQELKSLMGIGQQAGGSPQVGQPPAGAPQPQGQPTP